MSTNGEKVALMAANLIDEQLRVLPLQLAVISRTINASEGQETLAMLRLPRKCKGAQTGSGGNIVADKTEHPDKASDADVLTFQSDIKEQNPPHQSDYQRVVVGNALLAVTSFLKAHDMATMRTPEVQFLGHVTDGILNANRFSLHDGYRPVAAFDGLAIDSALNGTPVFDNGTQNGLVGVGDAVALLQWLSRYLRGDQGYVSGGDAG